MAEIASITQVQISLSLTPGWNVSSQFRMACNLEVHLDLMSRWQLRLDAFAYVMWGAKVCSLLNWITLQTVTPFSSNGPTVKLPFNITWKFQLVQNAVVGLPMISLLCELHWLSLCFWVQFRVLIFTYTILGSSYLRGHLCLSFLLPQKKLMSELILN